MTSGHPGNYTSLTDVTAAAFPDAYETIKELTDKGVEFHICRNAAKGRGYAPEDFYDLFTVVPAAVIDIAK